MYTSIFFRNILSFSLIIFLIFLILKILKLLFMLICFIIICFFILHLYRNIRNINISTKKNSKHYVRFYIRSKCDRYKTSYRDRGISYVDSDD